MKGTFTFLMLSSLCFKQSVKKTFLTPFFSSVFRILCRVYVKTSFCVSYFQNAENSAKSSRLLTCLLERSVRSTLLRISRCGLTSRVSWNTGFLPDKGIYYMLKKKKSMFCINLLGFPWAQFLQYYLATDVQGGDFTHFWIIFWVTHLSTRMK